MLLSDNTIGITIRDKGHCRRCGIALHSGERVMPIWILVDVVKHPKTEQPTIVLLSRTDMPAPQNELIHINCADPALRDRNTIILTEKVPVLENLPDLRPRGDDAHCIKCNKTYMRGDRLTLCYIVQGVGRDPETSAVAAMVGNEYETKHVFCEDPKLELGDVISAA